MSKSVFEYFKGPLFLNWFWYGYHFWSVLRHLSVFSKNINFATLVNIRQKL